MTIDTMTETRTINGQTVLRGSRDYWRLVAIYGVPEQDRDAITCESDAGHGPCGTYHDWADGTCKHGHEITFSES